MRLSMRLDSEDNASFHQATARRRAAVAYAATVPTLIIASPATVSAE